MKQKILFFVSVAFVFSSLCIPSPFSSSADLDVTVLNVTPFAFCSLLHKGPYSDMQAVITQLINHMQNQNISPQGPPLSIYHNMPNDTEEADLEWEVGFPVSPHVAPQDPLRKKVWNYTQVAQALHIGPYENSGDTILEILDWLDENGYVQDGPILGKYLNLPSSETPPDKLRTEIWIPCREE